MKQWSREPRHFSFMNASTLASRMALAAALALAVAGPAAGAKRPNFVFISAFLTVAPAGSLYSEKVTYLQI